MYSKKLIKKAHKATLYNEKTILKSNRGVCFYCGYQFNPHKEYFLNWVDFKSPQGKTLLCPLCYADAVIGSASQLPITKRSFLRKCSFHWFGGYSRISNNFPIEALKVNYIEVD